MSLPEISTLIDLDQFRIEPFPEKQLDRSQNRKSSVDRNATTQQTLHVGGQGLVGFNVEQRPSGDFVITITASSFVDETTQSTRDENSVPEKSEVDSLRKDSDKPRSRNSSRTPRENSGSSPSRNSRARLGSNAETDAPLLSQEE
jgi:hypothetical protein